MTLITYFYLICRQDECWVTRMSLSSKRTVTESGVSSELVMFYAQLALCFVSYTRHRYILWVPWYMHLLVKFLHYLLADGSHGFSKYGWKFVPLCILHSGGKTLPVAAVFGLEEDSQSLNMLLVSVHCHKSLCECTLDKSNRISCAST